MERTKFLKNITFFTSVLLTAISMGCTAAETTVSEGAQSAMFEAVDRDLPLPNEDLRKWDVATVADLDQDGFPDLLLNDHGFSVKILWNNKGRFQKPYDLIMGDMHGITAADFDKDGNVEIVISRGGGSGSNARNTKLFRVTPTRDILNVAEFDTPLPFMRGRTVKLVDLDGNGWLDLINFAFPSKEMQGQSENYIFENTQNGQFTEHSRLPPVFGDGQKTLITDINQDGLPDLLLYGNGETKAFQATAAFQYDAVSHSVFRFALTDVTSINEIDYDNDGDYDLFVTRAKELKAGQTFYDQKEQTLGYYWKRGAYVFPPFKAGPVIELVNFQSQWPSKDLLIGESSYPYAFPGETHIGRDVRLVNSDALGFPDTLDKKGAYIGYIGNQQWQFAINTFSVSTGVIRGVESFPSSPLPEAAKDILLENRGGKYVDVTEKLGLSYLHNTVSSAIADINNDGFSDMVVIKQGDLIHPNQALVYVNQKGKQFVEQSFHGIITPELGALGLGIEPIDYNLDGKVDFLVGNERGQWHLFKNTHAGGDYVQIAVPTSPEHRVPALGASVSVTACHYTQVKRVGQTSAAYSQSANPVLHFGIGDCDKPVLVTVTWTNGETLELTVDDLNSLVRAEAD